MGVELALTLFNGAQFLLEVDIERGGGHLFLPKIEYGRGLRWAETAYQGDFVVLKVLEPCVEGLSWRGNGSEANELEPEKGHGDEPSGVWNNPFPPTSSLVGLALPETPPGRGEPTVKPTELLRDVGPID